MAIPNLPLRLLQLSGPLQAIGGQLGEATAAEVSENFENYARNFRDKAQLDDADVARLGTEFRRLTHEWHPRIGAALDALAEGAGVSTNAVYAINARTELLAGSPLPLPDACTASAVLPAASATGNVLLGQNWDWASDTPDTTILLATRDERGHEVLCLAEAGMLAKVGLNDAGLGLTVNLLRSESDGPRAGVPYHVRLRAALEEREFGAAVAAASAGPRAASVNILIAQAGEHPSAVDLELSPDGASELTPDDGLLVHTNHFRAKNDVSDVGPKTMPSTGARCAQAEAILRPLRGRISTDTLEQVFRDHSGGIDAICRHAGADLRLPPGDKTVYSVVMDLSVRRFGIAPGPVCHNEFSYAGLDELLPDPASPGACSP
ncbi:C45 family autoproteolytic acyltransferase/hydrolase [Saxibacter everestensis]|uniref:C45 family autoproteolytic acyltransferase/hydrolase n=1 Tax=Saxibacter everestensis TaxID=2909229 RepID=A0ABY8QSH7_9MICO|nr:C45 family autoproteolytic acyltransferase/hydrolase [Brevibacteriaceae bacterium ZFBP1038]